MKWFVRSQRFRSEAYVNFNGAVSTNHDVLRMFSNFPLKRSSVEPVEMGSIIGYSLRSPIQGESENNGRLSIKRKITCLIFQSDINRFPQHLQMAPKWLIRRIIKSLALGYAGDIDDGRIAITVNHRHRFRKRKTLIDATAA